MNSHSCAQYHCSAGSALTYNHFVCSVPICSSSMPAPQAENGTPRTELQDLQHKSQQVTDDVSVWRVSVREDDDEDARALFARVCGPPASEPAGFFKCNDKRCLSCVRRVRPHSCNLSTTRCPPSNIPPLTVYLLIGNINAFLPFSPSFLIVRSRWRVRAGCWRCARR